MFSSIVSHPNPQILETGLLIESGTLGLVWSSLPASLRAPPCPLCTLLHRHLCGCWGSNSGPQPFTVSTLPMKPSLQPSSFLSAPPRLSFPQRRGEIFFVHEPPSFCWLSVKLFRTKLFSPGFYHINPTGLNGDEFLSVLFHIHRAHPEYF